MKIVVSDPATFAPLRNKIMGDLFLVRPYETDVFTDLINTWPRGDQSLTLDVQRGGQTLTIGPFTPRTLGLHPTQVYETISMFLLIGFSARLLPVPPAYDGQVFTLFIVCYAIHRFLNETLRNDTDIVGIPALNMTLSQNISVLMFLFASAWRSATANGAHFANVSPRPLDLDIHPHLSHLGFAARDRDPGGITLGRAGCPGHRREAVL